MLPSVNAKEIIAATFMLVIFGGQSFSQQPAKPAQLSEIYTSLLVKVEDENDELKKLLKARHLSAYNELSIVISKLENGIGDLGQSTQYSYDVGQRVVQSGLELLERTDDQVRLMEKFLELAKRIELMSKERPDYPPELRYRSQFNRLEVEIQLLRMKRGANRSNGN